MVHPSFCVPCELLQVRIIDSFRALDNSGEMGGLQPDSLRSLLRGHGRRHADAPDTAAAPCNRRLQTDAVAGGVGCR